MTGEIKERKGDVEKGKKGKGEVELGREIQSLIYIMVIVLLSVNQ